MIMIRAKVDPAMVVRLRAARAAEDAALRQRLTAVAVYAAAIEHHARVVGRATATVHRRMAPMKPGMYVKVEEMLAGDGPRYAAPRHAALTCLHVRRTHHAVNQARARLAEVTAAEDAKVTAARQVRTEATAELLRLTADRAPMRTGLSPQQLGTMRSGR